MIGRLAAGLVAALGAGGGAQFPEFSQQYLQRLGGRLDQSREDLARLKADAQALGRTLESYLQALMDGGSEAAQHAARREMERLDQGERLETAYRALSEAAPLERPFAFARHFDSAIARDTWSGFEPALPLGLEGLAYAGFGALLMLLLLSAGTRGGRALQRGWQRTPPMEMERHEPTFRTPSRDL